MARPAVSAKITAKHLTNGEKNSKIDTENKLRGDADLLRPPDYLLYFAEFGEKQHTWQSGRFRAGGVCCLH